MGIGCAFALPAIVAELIDLIAWAMPESASTAAPARAEPDVVGFDVAMDDPRLVRVDQAGGKVMGDVQRS